MKKFGTTEEGKKQNYIKIRYGLKRHREKWKNRKKYSEVTKKRLEKKRERRRNAPPVIMATPKNFSLIGNTDEVLSYFIEVEKLLRSGVNVMIDMSEVDKFTPDAIALLIASINSEEFIHDAKISGLPPRRSELNKLFAESGFYEHVHSEGFKKTKSGNFLYKEMHVKVENNIAKKVTILGMKHVFGKIIPFDQLFNTIIESMSNTHDHAHKDEKAKCYWWLYLYTKPNEKVASYTFVDLGVGIFKSLRVEGYFNKLIKGTPLLRHIDIVDDLLSGKIKSRESIDNEIRGKGIPEIVGSAKSPYFSSFYIIANDVKIDLKTGQKEQLNSSLDGTLLHWELRNKNGN